MKQLSPGLHQHQQHQYPRLAKKLRGLCHNLAFVQELFMEDAMTAVDRHIALAVFDLATFAQQSHNEIVSEIQMIERKPYTKGWSAFCGPRWNGLHSLNDTAYRTHLAAGSSLLVVKHCAVIENRIIGAYQHLLHNDASCNRVKSLLEHQLRGFRYNMARLQLLGDLGYTACYTATPVESIQYI